MNPAVIDSMSWRMAEVYAAVTDRILINLARHFPFIQETGLVGSAWEYQATKLAELGQVRKETIDILMQSLGGGDEALRGVLEAAIMEGLKGTEQTLRDAAKKGLLGTTQPPELAPNQMQAFQAMYRQSADKLNLVNTVMLESTESAYTTTVADITQKLSNTLGILNTETGEVVSGVTSFNQALRDGVKRMVQNGLTGFIDHGGHHWSPEAYVAMDVRTTMHNTALQATWERMEQFGDDLYMVSWHDGARPLCYPWQGKVISRSDWRGTVEDLDGNTVQVYAQSDTSYGQPAGLFGINCGHYAMPFIPGYSIVREPKQDEAENKQEYLLSQQQRKLERDLREQKRDLEVMKAQGTSDAEIKKQRMRVREASKNLDDFCEETGRARRRGREVAPIRATWPQQGGEVTRFDRRYISASQTPPVKD